MEMAKVTSKGQITIPITIRRMLGVNEGDKLLFLERPNGVLVVNPNTFREEDSDESSAAAQAPDAPVIEAPGSDSPESAASADSPVAISTNSPAATPRTTTGAQRAAVTPSSNAAPSSGKRRSGSDSFDLAALLDDIRSMGSKI